MKTLIMFDSDNENDGFSKKIFDNATNMRYALSQIKEVMHKITDKGLLHDENVDKLSISEFSDRLNTCFLEIINDARVDEDIL